MPSLSAEAEIDERSKNQLLFFKFLINKFYWYYKRVPWYVKEFNGFNILNSFLNYPNINNIIFNFYFYSNSKVTVQIKFQSKALIKSMRSNWIENRKFKEVSKKSTKLSSSTN